MIKDLAIRNRSYRRFDESRRVTREGMIDWVDATRYAASSINFQPLKYLVIDQPEDCAALFPLTGWARRLPDYAGPPEGYRPTGYIVICCDLTIAESVQRFDRDIGIAAQTIMLAAVEAGFGGCMIGNFPKQSVANLLKLPEHLPPCLILALGAPGEEIILEDAAPGADIGYYRDADFVHHVPKRTLEEILL